MVPLVAALIATSTTVPDWARPPAPPPPEESAREKKVREHDEARKKKRQERIEEDHDEEALGRQISWTKDRRARFALHLLFGFTIIRDTTLFVVDAGFGLNKRVNRILAVEARGTIGAGSANRAGPVFDSGVDLSLRVGYRFFFEVGGFGRLWRFFEFDRGFEGGGGGMIGLGLLLLDDRSLDLFVRAQVGAHSSGSDGSTHLMGGGTAALGWNF